MELDSQNKPDTQSNERPVRREPVRPDMTPRRSGRFVAFVVVAVVSAAVCAAGAFYGLRVAGRADAGTESVATATTGSQPAPAGQGSMVGNTGLETG